MAPPCQGSAVSLRKCQHREVMTLAPAGHRQLHVHLSFSVTVSAAFLLKRLGSQAGSSVCCVTQASEPPLKGCALPGKCELVPHRAPTQEHLRLSSDCDLRCPTPACLHLPKTGSWGSEGVGGSKLRPAVGTWPPASLFQQPLHLETGWLVATTRDTLDRRTHASTAFRVPS